MTDYLISVLVPTRNRQRYAMQTIQQLAKLPNDIEIIIQDNSDENSLYEAIQGVVDGKRIQYDFVGEQLPFSANYNLAAEKANGQFLCAIGDDDGVLPNIVECANWMIDNSIHIVKPAKDPVYFYPGNANMKKNACLGFGIYSGSYYYANPEAAFISLLADGGHNYILKDLTSSYHGLVSMKLMDEVKRKTGYYYSGLTPDMYSAVCLSLIPDVKLAVIDYPITLPGVCPKSGSAASDSGKHVGKLNTAPHLQAYRDYEWSDIIPKYYSVETIWAETMVYAARQMGRLDLIEKYFNRMKLLQYIFENNKNQRDEILSELDPNDARLIKLSYRDRITDNARISKLLSNVSAKISGCRKVVRNLNNISDAVEVFTSELNQYGANTPWIHE